MTSPLSLRAALPIVWINERLERKNPSLSASNMTTRETSGISIPSLNKLIPTITSYVPIRKSLIISIRSNVLISECR